MPVSPPPFQTPFTVFNIPILSRPLHTSERSFYDLFPKNMKEICYNVGTSSISKSSHLDELQIYLLYLSSLSFISKYLLSTRYMSDTILGTWVTVEQKPMPL